MIISDKKVIRIQKIIIVFFFQVLREVYASKANTIIIDCTREILAEVLKQAQQVILNKFLKNKYIF